jgi:hypothetical protein
MERKFLWKPDPPSVKDWRAEPIIKAAIRRLGVRPSQVKLSDLITAILDQLSLGSCAAQAVTQAVHGAQVRAGIVDAPYQSRLRLYRYARAILGDPQSDSGTSLRACLDVDRKLGFCPESAWPYEIDKFKLMPPAEAERLSHDQIGQIGHYRIDSTGDRRLEEIQDALASRFLVVFGTQVSDKFLAYGPGSAPLEAPTAAENILGGHGLVFGGYEKINYGASVVFDVVNSWSDNYGDHGWCRFSESYVADSRTADLWIVESAPDFSELA